MLKLKNKKHLLENQNFDAFKIEKELGQELIDFELTPIEEDANAINTPNPLNGGESQSLKESINKKLDHAPLYLSNLNALHHNDIALSDEILSNSEVKAPRTIQIQKQIKRKSNILRHVHLNKLNLHQEHEFFNRILRPNHLALDKRNNYINTNRLLFDEFKNAMGYDIYTKNRYGIRYHVTELDEMIAQKGLEIRSQSQKVLFRDYVTLIQNTIRARHMVRSTQHQPYPKGYQGKLPPKLDLSLLKAPTVSSFDHVQEVGQKILGITTEQMLYDNELGFDQIDAKSLMRLGIITENDLMRDSDGN